MTKNNSTDWMKQGDDKAQELIESKLKLLKEIAPENNSKNWKEIEEEFIQNFLVYFQDQRLEDPTIGVENGNTGIDALIVNDQIQKRAMNKANRVLNFFKPYFQEEMHDKAVEELEEHEMSNLEKQQHIKRLSQKDLTAEDLVSNANPLEKAVEELEDICYSCGGKGFYSKVDGGQTVSDDFNGEKLYIKPEIKKYPCLKCNGTGRKPEVSLCLKETGACGCYKCLVEYANKVFGICSFCGKKKHEGLSCSEYSKQESKNECKYCKREHGDLACREYVNAMVQPESSWEDTYAKDLGMCCSGCDCGHCGIRRDIVNKIEKEAYERGWNDNNGMQLKPLKK